jgi:hypothetical protein
VGYKNKTVTKKRTEYRTRTIPGVGIETYSVEVPYTTVEPVWEPDTSSSTSYDTPTYCGE